MTSNKVTLPQKELVDFLSDSRPWLEFLNSGGYVKDDIVIADPFKAGTTWTQRILEQILNNGEESTENLSDKSPWLDSSWGNHPVMIHRLVEQKERGQRRVIKSHVPADTIPISDVVFYIFVGRNGKDLLNSFHNYLINFNQETIQVINKLHSVCTGRNETLIIPQTSGEFFDLMLDTNGNGCCDIFDITLSWWKLRKMPNVLMLHYSQLIDNLEKQIMRIAKFIHVDTNTLNIDKILEHCNFYYMKQYSEKLVPFNGQHMKNSRAFFHKGPERNFNSELTRAQIARFDKLALERMGPDCARWLETGMGVE